MEGKKKLRSIEAKACQMGGKKIARRKINLEGGVRRDLRRNRKVRQKRKGKNSHALRHYLGEKQKSDEQLSFFQIQKQIAKKREEKRDKIEGEGMRDSHY